MRARFISATIVIIVVVLAVTALPAAANLPGAIFSTDASCTGVNVNLFDAKSDVYLDGGPKGPSGSGLVDGAYHVRVTAPNGTVLGQSAGADVQVTNGEFDECYGLFALTAFADTPNLGGEYKVWISPDPTFPNSLSKTDNFKVLADPAQPVPTVTTEVADDRSGADITDQVVSVVEGETFTVHDLASVSGSGATPTGAVTFDLYPNGVCDPQDGVLASDTVQLVAGAASSGQSVALPLGDPVELEYSYQASYTGDDVYGAALAECEPFFVAIVAGDVTPPTAAPEVGAGATGASELAFTGTATPWLAAVGSLLVAGGAALLVVARRRERLGFGA